MNILRAELVSTAITVLGTTFPRFVAPARNTTMHGKPSDMSVHMTLTRAVELAAEARAPSPGAAAAVSALRNAPPFLGASRRELR